MEKFRLPSVVIFANNKPRQANRDTEGGVFLPRRTEIHVGELGAEAVLPIGRTPSGGFVLAGNTGARIEIVKEAVARAQKRLANEAIKAMLSAGSVPLVYSRGGVVR